MAAIKAAYYAVIAHGNDPSQRAVQEMTGLIFGKKMQTREVLAVLRDIRNPVAIQLQASSTPVAPSSVKSPNPVAPQLQASSLHAGERADLKGFSLKGDTDVVETIVSTPLRARGERIAPAAKPLPDLPADVADDVERLIANDARKRKDGLISQGVIETGMMRLRRAYEKHGIDALLAGIEVALGKGLGLAYAAGCVRNHGGSSTTVAPSLFGAAREPAAEEGHDYPNYFRPKATV